MNVRAGRMHRQHDDARVLAPLPDDSGRLDPIQFRHRVVHDYHVRLLLQRLLHGFATIPREADDFHVALRVNQGSQSFGHDGVIVRNQNSDRHAGTRTVNRVP